MCMPFLLGLDPCNLTAPTGWLTTELFVQIMAGIAIAGLLSLLIPEDNNHQQPDTETNQMMLITLQGPQASGKTLMHEKLREILPEIEQKTGHEIQVREVYDEALSENSIDMSVPCFEVMRFKASGKWIDTFCISAPALKDMRDVAHLLRSTKNMPEHGHMVVVRAVSDAAEEFFYPIEVK